jgi:spore cortex biosynthesis protein YabQ
VNTVLPASVSTQAYIFLYSVLIGMFIAFIYDIFRIKRKVVKTGVLFLYIEDLLFWIIVAIFVFIHVCYFNDGEFRFYILAGAIIGVIIYILLLSKIIVKSSVAVLNIIWKIIKYILFVLIYPIRLIYKIVMIPAKLVFRPAKKLCRSARGITKVYISKMALWYRINKNARKKV